MAARLTPAREKLADGPPPQNVAGKHPDITAKNSKSTETHGRSLFFVLSAFSVVASAAASSVWIGAFQWIARNARSPPRSPRTPLPVFSLLPAAAPSSQMNFRISKR